MKALTLAAVVAALAVGCSRGAPDHPEATPDQPAVEQPAPQPLPDLPGTITARPVPGQPFDTALPRPELTVKTTVLRDPEGESHVGSLRTITVQVQVQGADPGELALELQAPGELMYERRTAVLSGSPFDVQKLEFQVPVAGTMIDRNALTGTWAANFFVAGQPVAADSFELLP